MRRSLLVYKSCLEALSVDTKDLVIVDMLSIKKKFQHQVQEAMMPAHTLFLEGDGSRSVGFIELSAMSTSSPIKSSMSTLSLSSNPWWKGVKYGLPDLLGGDWFWSQWIMT
jgi:hypothetical protein